MGAFFYGYTLFAFIALQRLFLRFFAKLGLYSQAGVFV